MNGRICNVERNWNLGHYINLCVDIDARLGASEPSPFKKRHTQNYCGGIKGIVFTIELHQTLYQYISSGQVSPCDKRILQKYDNLGVGSL